MAIPLAILAIVFIDLGGVAFALFMIAAGWLCLIELYRMLARWRPVTVVGLAAVAGMVLAARSGNRREILEVMVATVPVLFLFVVARGHGSKEEGGFKAACSPSPPRSGGEGRGEGPRRRRLGEGRAIRM